ncbi:MAG: ABC transporter substrate-binding protein [Succinivibrio sp.]|nr:ABC transporter substrate-binding protein [Succinivibrio sp.]
MKKLFTLLTVIYLSLFSNLSFAVDDSNPYALANEVAQQTFDELRKHKDKVADRAFLNNLIDNNLMPYVDNRYAAYKVIGKSLKDTTEQERNDFTEAFTDYLRNTFADTLGKYTDQELIKGPVTEVPADTKIVSVKFTIKQVGKADIAVVLKLRKNEKTGKWKAFDLIAENVSILDAKVAEINPIITKDGITKAITVLKQHK